MVKTRGLKRGAVIPGSVISILSTQIYGLEKGRKGGRRLH
jgi:hypothetical protein